MDQSGLQCVWLQQPPRRVLECVRVLAAVGNVPKTVRGLENAISPLTSITRVVSPSLVLSELCRARSGDLQLSCARRWAFKGDASLKDKAEAVAREKALHHNAIFFKASVLRNYKEASDRLYERVSFSEVPQFTSKASLVQFVADKCSPVRELEPSLVLGLLKNMGAVSLGPEGQNDIIYISDGDADYLESWCVSMMPTCATAPGSAPPSDVAFSVWWKAVGFCKEVPEVLMLLQRFLQSLREWGSDRPKTEEVLAAELQPLCKVVSFCDPTVVLAKMSSRTKKKLFVVENCTVTLSPHGFCVEGGKEEEGGEGLLSCLELRLLQDLRRRGSSLVWGEDLEQEVVSATVQRAEEWLKKKGVRVRKEEGVESGEEEKMETATVEREGESVASLMSLQQEFINLCISRERVEPSQVVQQLVEGGMISVTEDGAVESHQLEGATLSAEDCISRLIDRERRQLLGQSAESASGECPTGRKRGKRTQGRARKSQRLHT